MCMWGLVHGQRLINNFYIQSAPFLPSVPGIMAPADARRVGVMLSAPILAKAASDYNVFIHNGETGGVIAILDKYNASILLKVEDYGGCLLDAIYANTNAASGLTVYVNDILTNESMAELSSSNPR